MFICIAQVNGSDNKGRDQGRAGDRLYVLEYQDSKSSREGLTPLLRWLIHSLLRSFVHVFPLCHPSPRSPGLFNTRMPEQFAQVNPVTMAGKERVCRDIITLLDALRR